MCTRSLLAGALTGLLALTLAGVSVSAAAAGAEPELAMAMAEPSVPSVSGREVPARPPLPEAAPAPVPEPSWPDTGVATVAVPDQAGSAVRAGDLPVWVAPVPGIRNAGDPVAAVRVEVMDADVAAAAGVDGPVVRLRRDDGRAPAGAVAVTVDYSSLRHRYGGDWAARLRLVQLPGGAVLPAENDHQAGRLTAEVEVTKAVSTIAVTAQEEGATGDYTATSLSPAGSWEMDTQGGSFSWSYELRTPPAPGGLAPSPSFGYSSGGTDGRTATTNNQPSWIGEGWSMWPGLIERSYRPCADDPATPRTGDLCWATENATMSFDGRSAELVREGTSRRWRPETDDGTRVEQRFDAGNGDVRGEHWVVTTTGGVQYHFGSRPAAASTWTVPVFGDGPGTGCGGSFASSWCQRAYRWNLDYIVDPHGNTITHHYAKETNRYARNLTDSAVSSYTRGGYLLRTEYGGRVGQPAAARVVYTAADRCRPGADCRTRTGAAWPDVPWDRDCAAATCPGRYSPTFWSTKRLSTVTTQVRDGSGYRAVDTWTFAHTYPLPGDGTSPGLWLRQIIHTGRVGGSEALPAVTFEGTSLDNRVNSATDGLPPMLKHRITTIHNGSGGDINVHYAPTNCSPGSLPAPGANTRRCFPVRWAPPPEPEPRDDWFHKHVVDQITLEDRVGGGMPEVLRYDYLGGAAWRFDDNPLIPATQRTWSQWRGYEKVRVRHGNPQREPDRPQSLTQYQYFRGMHGDRLPGGGTRTVHITDSSGTALADREPLAGFLREEITYNGVGGPVVSGEIHSPWTRGPTATAGSLQAFQVERVRTVTRTALSAGGFRRTRVDTEVNQDGNPVQVDDRGDLSNPADDRCTRISYARNTGSWLLDPPSRVTTVGVACDATPSYPADAISDVRTYYDGRALGAAPTAGDVTKTEEAASYSGSTPRYVTAMAATYDGYGRVVESTDPLGNRTTTSYAPATGLATSTTVTNPLGHTETTTLEPAWGEPVSVVATSGRRTDLAYDPLGRLTGVWRPGRWKALGQPPDLRVAYQVRTGAPSSVRTETLRANGNYQASVALLDGFLRQRQVQAPSPDPDGGRIITDTLYDSRGLTYLTRDPYFQDAAPGAALFEPIESEIPQATLSRFDGAGRPTDAIVLQWNQEQWRTRTAYGGDHVAVTPPPGGTATATYVDARDQTVALRQYRGPTPTGGYDATGYRYTKAGKLAEVTDPAGNTWRYEYDVRGRLIRTLDPDLGETVLSYDDAGQLRARTDARGETVATGYDPSGRKVETRLGSPEGPLLAEWVYDTLSVGDLTSATRYQDGAAYTRAVTGYDPGGRPEGESVTIPATETGLAGTYTTTTSYRPDGSPSLVRLPALGDLSSAEALVHRYDDLGQLTSLTGAAAYLHQVSYTSLGELQRLERGDPADGPRVWQGFTYQDGTRRLSTSLTLREVPGDDQTVSKVSYAYDPAGNVTSVTDVQPGPLVDTQCFQHDHLRRMTEAWTQSGGCGAAPAAGTVGGPAPYWHSYRYDATGNRTELVRHGLGGAQDTVSSYTYPATGEPLPHAVQSVRTAFREAGFRYDPTGNTTGRPGGEELVWDAEGRLASISTTSYVYDADGQQLIRRDPGSVTLFAGGGELSVDTATGARTGTRYYGTEATGTVAVRTGAGVRWLVADRHHTAQLAIDADTLNVTSRRFDPFGNPRGEQPAWPGDRGFVGGTHNDATGLTRLGAREYDPALGRFLSVDPVIDPYDPQQLNGYAYANNSPATMTDPDGRKYFVDLDGYVTAPPAAGWTPRAKKRVAQRLKKWAPMYQARTKAWQARQRARQQAVSRARQHDFDAEGRRGRVGGGERRAKQFGEVYNALKGFGGGDKPIAYEAAKLLDDLSSGVFPSFSVCGEVEGGAIWGASATVCQNFDQVGWTFSGAIESGWEFGVDWDASVKVRINSKPANQVDIGYSSSLELSAEAGLGPHFGAGFERHDPAKGSGQLSAFIKAGIGKGASLGSLMTPLDNFNSGYVRKW